MDSSVQPQSELQTTQYTIDDWNPHDERFWDWTSWQNALMFVFSKDDWLASIEILAEGMYRIPIFNPEFLHRFAD